MKSSVVLAGAFDERPGLRSVLPRLRAAINDIDSDRIAGTIVVGERKTIASALKFRAVRASGFSPTPFEVSSSTYKMNYHKKRILMSNEAGEPRATSRLQEMLHRCCCTTD